MQLVFATHNQHKLGEVRNILSRLVPGFQPENLTCAADYNVGEPREDGATFAANALIKAHHVCAATQLPTIADDSGIAVDILGGAPGIFSARWAGRHGDDAANLQLLLDQLADVPDANRGAAFVCALALVTPDGAETVAIGQVRGQLLREGRGAAGFGYDPIFMPEAATGLGPHSFAEIDSTLKNQHSHRYRAFCNLVASPLFQQLAAAT